MQLQHVTVKLLLQNPDSVDLEPLIPIFHGWIQDQAEGELLLDVADYRHVPEGPGIVLIGYDGDYSVDNTDGQLGVRYNRKSGLDGSNQDRLKQSMRAALTVCQRLEADSRMGGKLRYNGQDIEIRINDRLLTPNDEASRKDADPELKGFFQNLFGEGRYSLQYGEDDPRKLFGVFIKSVQAFSTAELLERLV